MRRLFLIVISGILLAVIVLVERHGSTGRIGLDAMMRLVAEFQQQAERLPLRLTRVNEKEEQEIGDQLVQQYFPARVPDQVSSEVAAIQDYLEKVGQDLASHVQRGGIRYHFHFLDRAGFVNALALPGGHVFLGRGLLDMMKSEDELAAVLGHEIAHVDRRHCIERLQYELAARKLGLSIPHAVASIPISVFQAGYEKGKELEADRVGVGFIVASGYSPQGTIDLFQRFQTKQAQSEGKSATPLEEIAKITLSAPEEYFRSHPPATQRIAEVEMEIRSHQWKLSPVRPLQIKNTR